MTTCKPNFTTNELIEAGMPLTLVSRYIQQSEFSGVEYWDLARELCVDDYCSTCLRQGLDEGGTPVRLTGVYLYNPETKKHDHYSLKDGIGGSVNLAYWDHEELDHYIHKCAHCGEHVEGANSPIHDKVLAAKLHAERDARIAAKETKPTYVCGECGSLDVSYMQWHDPNKITPVKVDPTERASDMCRCESCEDECNIITTDAWEAKQKAEQEAAELAGPYWVNRDWPNDTYKVRDENRLLVATCFTEENAKALAKELNQGHAAIRKIQEN